MDSQKRADLERVDWVAAERSPEFQELVRKRRAFVLPATVFFLAWFLTFIVLAGYAPDFMGRSVYQGLTVGYVLAFSQFIMVWVLGGLYLRRSDRDFDPLAHRAAQRALETARRPAPAPARSAEPAVPDAVPVTSEGRPA
jgi:uncharacterized membrane protein (DUF485 family)